MQGPEIATEENGEIIPRRENLTEDDNENVEQNNSTNVEHLEEHEIFDVIPRRPIASEESDDEDENLNEHNEDGIENFNGHNEILV